MKISTDLRTEFAAEKYIAEGQRLEKQFNIEELYLSRDRVITDGV
jgi:hypothetical protein